MTPYEYLKPLLDLPIGKLMMAKKEGAITHEEFSKIIDKLSEKKHG